MTLTVSQVCSNMSTIQDWVEETEKVVSSQTSFDTFQPAEVHEIMYRFQAVLQSSLIGEQLTLMVRAISMLMNVTGNLVNFEDQMVEILHELLNNFLHLNQKEVTKELNNDVLDVVVQCGEVKELKMVVLEGLAGQLMAVIGNSNLVDWMRVSWLKTFNSLLSGSDYKLRETLGRELAEDIDQLVDYLYTCGDYDTQSSLVETLLRFTSKADRTKLAMAWFPNYALVQSLFCRIRDFECDCRNFLNCFNQGLGANQLVFSLPALTCQVGKQEMFKPPDQKYRQFWVDFNLGPRSLSIYYVNEMPCELWDLVTITQEMVTSSVTTCQAGTIGLTLSLCQSPHGILASQAVLVFSPDPKLLELLTQLFPHQAAASVAKPGKCSRAVVQVQLLLPKSSRPPPSIPSPVLSTVADLSSSQASLPCGQSSSRMSTAEVPVHLGSKQREALGYTDKIVVENKFEYTRCSQAQPVKLVIRKPEVGSEEEEDNNNVIPETPVSPTEAETSLENVETSQIKAANVMKEIKVQNDNKCQGRFDEKAKFGAEMTNRKETNALAEKKAEAERIAQLETENEARKEAEASFEKKKLELDANTVKIDKDEVTKVVDNKAKDLKSKKAREKAEKRVERDREAEIKSRKDSELLAALKASDEAEKKVKMANEEKATVALAVKNVEEEAANTKMIVKLAAAEKKASEALAVKRVEEEAEKKACQKARVLASSVNAEIVAKLSAGIEEVEALVLLRVEEVAENRALLIIEEKVKEVEVMAIKKAKEEEALNRLRINGEKKEFPTYLPSNKKLKSKIVEEAKLKGIEEAEREANGEVILQETPKNASDNQALVYEESLSAPCPAFITPSLTMSGGRKRAKRRLSLTKRKNSAGAKAKCIKLSFSPAGDSLNANPEVAVSGIKATDVLQPGIFDNIPHSPIATDNVASITSSHPSVTDTPLCSFPLKTTMAAFPHTSSGPTEITSIPPSQSAEAADSFPPSSCDSIKGLGQLLAEQPKLLVSNLHGKGRVSISPRLSQVVEGSQEEEDIQVVERDMSNKKVKERESTAPGLSQFALVEYSREVERDDETVKDETKMKVNMLKKMRSSFNKKRLLPNKSLMLEEDASEMSTNESVSSTISFTAEAPSYEEVYKRKKTTEFKKHKGGKRQRDALQKKTKVIALRSPIKLKDQPDMSVPPLIVSRKSINTSDQSNSLFSSSISNKKFFKSAGKLGQSISRWTDSLLEKGRKADTSGRRKTYSKTANARGAALSTSTASSTLPQSDPYSTFHISPPVTKLQLKAEKTKTGLGRKPSSKFTRAKSNHSTKLFSDDSDEEMNTVKPEPTSLSNPEIFSPSPKLTTKKGTTSRRKASIPPSILTVTEQDLPIPPAGQEGAGDEPEQGLEAEMILICIARVLEMVTRRGQGEMQNRERWVEIRRIAEREERRM